MLTIEAEKRRLCFMRLPNVGTFRSGSIFIGTSTDLTAWNTRQKFIKFRGLKKPKMRAPIATGEHGGAWGSRQEISPGKDVESPPDAVVRVMAYARLKRWRTNREPIQLVLQKVAIEVPTLIIC